MEMLPWAAVSILLLSVLGLWNYASTTRRDSESIRKELDDFKLKVAENYTTTPTMDKAISGLIVAINELKTEFKEFRNEIHRRGFQSGNQR